MGADYPDGYRVFLPGPTVDLESGFSTLWLEVDSQSIAYLATYAYVLPFTDSDYVYYIDAINITPQTDTSFITTIKINGVVYVVDVSTGSCLINLRMLTALNFIDGDTLELDVMNNHNSTRTFLIKVMGSKILRPASYGKAAVPRVSLAALYYRPNFVIPFVNESLYYPDTYDWDFGDGSSHSALETPSKSYSTPGTYDVSLTATNAFGSATQAYPALLIISWYENFGLFTEVDPASKITVTTNAITCAAVEGESVTYVYKDLGVDSVNAIDIKEKVVLTSQAATNDILFTLGLSNQVAALGDTGSIRLVAYLKKVISGYRWYLELISSAGASSASDYYAFTDPATFYIRMERAANATTITLKIYSDATYTTLVDTLSINHASGNTLFRYLYPMSAYGSGSMGAMTASIENLEVA